MTVGLYKRPDTFSTLVDSIIFSTARVRLLWVVCNGSPYLELFRAKDHDLAACTPLARMWRRRRLWQASRASWVSSMRLSLATCTFLS